MTIPALTPPPAAPQQGNAGGQQQPTPETPAQAKPDDQGSFAERFAGLTRKERELREQQRAFQQQREKAARDDEEYESFKKLRSGPKKDAMAFMKSLGLTYEDLTEIMLNDNKPTVEQELKSLRDEFDGERKARDEARQREEEESQQRERSRFLDNIRSHTQQSGDKYELIESQGAHELVFGVVEQYWNDHNVIPDLDEACRHVEEYLEAEARRIMGLKKFATPAKKDGELSDDKGQQGQKPAGNSNFTITNEGTAAPNGASSGYLPRDKSINRSAAMLRWN